MVHHVTIAMTRGTAHTRCTCGWISTRRAIPAGPGDDLPPRPAVEQLISAELAARLHVEAAAYRFDHGQQNGGRPG